MQTNLRHAPARIPDATPPPLERARCHCLQSRPFLASERERTTILFGNLTPKHEALIEAVFRGSGYRCEALPTPVKANYQTGKEFCNNGLCNPNYYTSGNLIDYLRRLRRMGLSVEEIVDRYVYFTIGGCGPCRFGMYESEYRLALENAGFPGFRVFTFRSNTAFRDGSKQPGLQYSVNLGLGLLNALNLGDALFDTAYRIRPYEVEPGATDRALDDALRGLAEFLRSRCLWEPFGAPRTDKPGWIAGMVIKIFHHLGGAEWSRALENAQARLNEVEVDWMRVKPVVKATGEFYSAISEGDANHNLYRFLESEGAEVLVDPIGNLIQYWIYQARLNNRRRKGLKPGYWKQAALLGFCEWFWGWQYWRTVERLGGLASEPEDQERVGQFAAPYYDLLTRGGEGHLIVGRALEGLAEHRSHMLIGVKPFGCMPSTQSDGVMAHVAASHPELLFLPLETLGEGEVHALSRVQMALGDAHRKASAEFENALRESRLTLDRIRAYVARHPETRRPFYCFRDTPGVAGTAAQFVLHVAKRMRRGE